MVSDNKFSLSPYPVTSDVVAGSACMVAFDCVVLITSKVSAALDCIVSNDKISVLLDTIIPDEEFSPSCESVR